MSLTVEFEKNISKDFESFTLFSDFPFSITRNLAKYATKT